MTYGSPLRGPALAALTAGLLAGATAFGIQRYFNSDACSGGGFECLGQAVLVTFIAPPVGALVLALALRLFGVPRPFPIAFAALATLVVLLYAGVGSTLFARTPVAVGLGVLVAVLAGAWAWALQPGRGAVPSLVIAAAAIGIAGTTSWLTADRLADDRTQRLADTGAPALLLTDDRWTPVSVAADAPDRITEIYDGLPTSGDSPRLVVHVAARPADPDAGCAEYAALVIDNAPADSCEPAGRDLWEIRQGFAVSHVALLDDAVVGVDLLYPGELDAEQAAEIVDGLQPVTLEALADLG